MISIKNLLEESDFKITILNNYIDILNFDEIILLSDNKIIISYLDKYTTIYGENLTILKLLDREILVSGKIASIEFR